ncbi:hypothetical protein GCM10009809_13140 [Isoptericola hypogeus]|uniref:Uncharacterized protein n=1 Tax=Isoptericola hypogeus TaxID=300179 RepID=A0ABN2J5U4_9MICO
MTSSTPDQPAATPDGAVPAEPAPDVPAKPAAAENASAPDRPRDATEDGTGSATADEPQDLTLLVDPDRVRRAPKYPVFLWVGALVGIVAGLVFATWLIDVTGSAESLMKPGVYVTVVVLATTALGLGVAGLLAVVADRRSLRRR